jgi:hypothetical protein
MLGVVRQNILNRPARFISDRYLTYYRLYTRPFRGIPTRDGVPYLVAINYLAFR